MSILLTFHGFKEVLTEDSELRSGARNRVRTGDLNLGKVALYQLSYSRFQSLLLKELFQRLSMQ